MNEMTPAEQMIEATKVLDEQPIPEMTREDVERAIAELQDQPMVVDRATAMKIAERAWWDGKRSGAGNGLRSFEGLCHLFPGLGKKALK